jgi:hypothetical protein
MRLTVSDISLDSSMRSYDKLRAPICLRIMHRAKIVRTQIPQSYVEKGRIGVAILSDRANHPLPMMVNARLLSTEFEVITHANGACSIPLSKAPWELTRAPYFPL